MSLSSPATPTRPARPISTPPTPPRRRLVVSSTSPRKRLPLPPSSSSSSSSASAPAEHAGNAEDPIVARALEPSDEALELYKPVLARLNRFEESGCAHDGTETSLYGELTPRCVLVVLGIFRKYGMRGVGEAADANALTY